MRFKSITLKNEFMLICIWVLLCLRLIGNISGIEYIIFLLTASSAVFNIVRKGISIKHFKFETSLLVLLGIEVIGLLDNWGIQAFKNVVALILIICFIYSCLEADYSGEKSYYIAFYYMLQLSFLFIYFTKKNSFFYQNNTLAAGILFMHLAYILFFLTYKEKKNKLLRVSQLAISSLLSMFFVYTTGSRTALSIYFIVGVSCVAFYIIDFQEKYLNYIFWIIVLLVIFVIVFYINIRNFSWYDKVNQYSQLYFSKNIDSARPHLWATELERLKGHVLFGLGTGVLPQMDRYAEASFHNTYIQLLIQNGVLGLGTLILFMNVLWENILKKAESFVGKYMLAVLIGVIIYNCFEVTLLSNKIFIGILQWFILVLGINILHKNVQKST